jgi:secondary thiamine-phosphate synthase enzyme
MWVASTKAETGLLTLFIQHTSASLVIQENADPDVVLDLADFFERIAPEFSKESPQKMTRVIVTTPKARTICQRISARL